jgi:hypothetical protein
MKSVKRIENLVAQERPQSRVDTRLRAAQLLRGTAPELSQRLQSAALDELPHVAASRGIVMSLMALEPERGEALLLTTKDRLVVYNQLVNYWVTRANPLRAASLLRQAAAQGITGLNGFPGIIKAVVSADPMQAVDLFALVLATPGLSTSSAGPPLLAGILSSGLVEAAGSRPDATRGAVR